MSEKETAKNWIIVGCVVFMFVFVFVFIITNMKREVKKIVLRNASDGLILFVELATDPGGDFIQAENDYLKMSRNYLYYIQKSRERHIGLFHLTLWLFSEDNIEKKLEDITGILSPLNFSKEEIKISIHGSNNEQQKAAQKRIKMASEVAAKLLKGLKPLSSGKLISDLEPEVVPEEIKDVVKHSLKRTREKVKIYANDPNIVNSEAVYMASREAMVYLYLIRFRYREIVGQEEIRIFQTNLNQAIYYNQVLQAKINNDEYQRLISIYSTNELRYLRLMQLIIDNDIPQAYALLQLTASH